MSVQRAPSLLFLVLWALFSSCRSSFGRGEEKRAASPESPPPVRMLLQYERELRPPATTETSAAREGERGHTQGKPFHPVAPPSYPLWSYPIQGVIRYHREVGTHLDGPRCPLYPSCSAYADRAIREYSLRGLLSTLDRLFFRERGSLHQKFMPAPKRLSKDLRYYDPPEDSLGGKSSARPSFYGEDFSD